MRVSKSFLILITILEGYQSQMNNIGDMVAFRIRLIFVFISVHNSKLKTYSLLLTHLIVALRLRKTFADAVFGAFKEYDVA